MNMTEEQIAAQAANQANIAFLQTLNQMGVNIVAQLQSAATMGFALNQGIKDRALNQIAWMAEQIEKAPTA